MNLEAVPLQQSHLAAIMPKLREWQSDVAEAFQFSKDAYRHIKAAGPTSAFLSPQGSVVSCVGLIDIDGLGRAQMWVILTNDRANDANVLAAIKTFMKENPRRRYELHADPRWPETQFLAEVAGFEREGVMKRFMPDGSERELWALTNKEAL